MSGNNQMFLENAIRDYAHDLLAIHTVGEYQYVIGEWQKYINLVVDAERMALENHQQVLSKVMNQMQQEQQASAMFAMLALSLLAGPALSWIGAGIEFKLYPFLTSQKRFKTIMAYTNDRSRGEVVRMIHSENTHNHIMAKVFGDTTTSIGQQVVGNYLLNPMVNKTSTRAKGKSYQELMALSQIPANSKSNDSVPKSEISFGCGNDRRKENNGANNFRFSLGSQTQLKFW